MRKQLAAVGRGGLNLVAVLAVVFGIQSLIHGRVPDTVGLTVMSVVVIAAYIAGSRWIERRTPTELVGPQGFGEFAAGCAIGLVLFSVVMGLLWAAGNYRPSGWGSVTPLAAGFLVALMAAVLEEILFRGFLFRLTAKLLGTWGALLVTSILFGAAHAFNRGATVGSSVAIALEAGVLLGAAYATTQRLWLPIGLHLGWNFTEGSVFGMSVSGNARQNSLITGTLHGPNLLTGGAFGPEASILAVLVCLIASSIILWRMVKPRRVEPPAWKNQHVVNEYAVAV